MGHLRLDLAAVRGKGMCMKWLCSYAYDVPCYYDFCVEAETEEEAEKICEKALAERLFSDTPGEPCWENGGDNERVFVSGKQDDDRYGSEPELKDGKLIKAS